MNLHSHRILIRNLRSEDLKDFYHYRSNPEVVKYQSFEVMDLPQATDFLSLMKDRDFGNPGEWVQYGIIDKERQQLVGDCAVYLHPGDPRIAEVGISIAHTEQNKGYAKETFTTLLKFLFDTQKLHRIVEIVDAENTASLSLLRSMGFRKEGHFLENIFFKGKWGSEFQYAMLKSEWDKRK